MKQFTEPEPYMSIDQIAKRLGMSRAGAHVVLVKALAKFKRALAKRGLKLEDVL